MNEIYWITRFDAINILCLTLFCCGIALTLLIGVLYYVFNGQSIYDKARGYENSVKEYEGYKKTCKGILNYVLPTTIIACLLMLFIPTTKEALLIYGVGGTIDYVKSNPVAKQIPDKCIIALDKWVDSLSESKDSTIVK